MRLHLIFRGVDPKQIKSPGADHARPHQKWSLYSYPPIIKHGCPENPSYTSMINHDLVWEFPIAMFDEAWLNSFQNGLMSFTVHLLSDGRLGTTLKRFLSCVWKLAITMVAIRRCWAGWPSNWHRVRHMVLIHAVDGTRSRCIGRSGSWSRETARRRSEREVSRGYHLVLKGTLTANHFFVTAVFNYIKYICIDR